jgi:hypothetical protein
MPTSNTAQITPSMSYGAIQIAQRELDHSKYDLESAWQDELAEGLAQFEDQTLVQYFQNGAFTNTQLGGAGVNYTEALYLTQLQSVITGGKSKVKVGPGGNTSFIFHSAQIDDLLGIASFTSAAITQRGDGPAITGRLTEHFGVGCYMSDNVFVSSSLAYCPIFSREALAMARLYKPKFRQQFAPDNIAWKLIAWQEFGYVALNVTSATVAAVKAV